MWFYSSFVQIIAATRVYEKFKEIVDTDAFKFMKSLVQQKRYKKCQLKF